MPGDHLSPGAGAGTELVQLRPYEVGDDVRQLDPASTARTGIPHVRLQVPERALTTWLVLDVSPSMAFGTEQRLKADVAMGVAAAVARLATRRGGRAALLRAGAPEGRLLPPRGGRHAQVMIERALAEGVARDAEHGTRERVAGDALARALVQAGRVARRPGLVVVVSDFREEGWRGPLAALSRAPQRHRRRGARSARGLAAEGGPPGARRPRDRRAGRGRQLTRARARALRRARGRAPRGGGRRPARRPRRPHRARHRARLAARARAAGSIAGGGAAPFAQRRRTSRARRPANELRRTDLPARPARRSRGHRPAPARPTAPPPLRRALPGRADRRARHSGARRAGAATSRRRCSRSRPPASCSPWRGRRPRWRCPSSRPPSSSSPTPRAR